MAWYHSTEMGRKTPALQISKSHDSSVVKLDGTSWHLEIPASTRRSYRLAQLDDHGSLRRRNFPWKPPLTMHLQARVSTGELPGTWGFGLWNDPFSLMFAYNRLVPRVPVLPDAAWFFHASPQNYLSFRDDLPACGFLAATFSSSRVHPLWLALTSPALAFALVPGLSQLIRRVLRRVVGQDAAQLQVTLTEWHAYALDWEPGLIRFRIDEVDIFETKIVPQGPLSLVMWVDNQYAALPPRGPLRYGILPNPEPAWLEIRDLELESRV